MLVFTWELINHCRILKTISNICLFYKFDQIKLYKLNIFIFDIFFLNISRGGGGCEYPHVSGHLPTGKQAEMESRLNFDSDEVLKTKVQGGGGATKMKNRAFLRFM